MNRSNPKDLKVLKTCDSKFKKRVILRQKITKLILCERLYRPFRLCEMICAGT